MELTRRCNRFVSSVLLGLSGLSALVAHAETGAPSTAPLPAQRAAFILVASKQLADPSYRQSVILVVPVRDDLHVGLIVNRPTNNSLASAFPDHAPSKKVVDPIYFGGPMLSGAMLALVQAAEAPGGGSIAMLDGLYLCTQGAVIDQVIETRPNQARYFAGAVLWRPGELEAELERGFWHAMDAEIGQVLRANPEPLWHELIGLALAVRT